MIFFSEDEWRKFVWFLIVALLMQRSRAIFLLFDFQNGCSDCEWKLDNNIKLLSCFSVSQLGRSDGQKLIVKSEKRHWQRFESDDENKAWTQVSDRFLWLRIRINTEIILWSWMVATHVCDRAVCVKENMTSWLQIFEHFSIFWPNSVDKRRINFSPPVRLFLINPDFDASAPIAVESIAVGTPVFRSHSLVFKNHFYRSQVCGPWPKMTTQPESNDHFKKLSNERLQHTHTQRKKERERERERVFLMITNPFLFARWP